MGSTALVGGVKSGYLVIQSPYRNILHRFLHTIQHTHILIRHTFTIRRFATRLFTPFFSQVMGSQMNSKLLDKILEDDMISLSGCESDVDLPGTDLGLDLEEYLDTTEPYSIIDELMDSLPTHHTKDQHFANTITSTIFSTVSHLLSTMTTTTTHSTVNISSPTLTTSHNDTKHNTSSYTNHHHNK